MFSVAATHPAMAGHFPGNPVVPGAVILSYLASQARQQGITITGIKRCKFLSLLLPEQPFTIDLNGENGKFTIVSGDAVIAKGIALVGTEDGR